MAKEFGALPPDGGEPFEPLKRKIIQIATTGDASVAIVFALADDGTLWRMPVSRIWDKMPALPDRE